MKFIIRSGEFRPLAALLEHLARATETHPQQVEVRDYQSKRSLEQNAYLWGVLYSQARDWILEHEGESVDPLVLHEQMKARYQPVVGSYMTQIVIDGIVRDVDVPIPKSTTKNTVPEMAEFIEKVTVFFIEKHGVQFRDDRYE